MLSIDFSSAFDSPERVGALLATRCDELDLTQQQVAELADISLRNLMKPKCRP